MTLLYNCDFEGVKSQQSQYVLKSLLNVKLRLEDMRKKLSEKISAWTQEEELQFKSAVAKLELVVSGLEHTLMIFEDF